MLCARYWGWWAEGAAILSCRRRRRAAARLPPSLRFGVRRPAAGRSPCLPHSPPQLLPTVAGATHRRRLLPSPPAAAAAGAQRGKLAVATVQYTLMAGLCITYSVTAGQSLKGVASEECDGKDCQEVGAGECGEHVAGAREAGPDGVTPGWRAAGLLLLLRRPAGSQALRKPPLAAPGLGCAPRCSGANHPALPRRAGCLRAVQGMGVWIVAFGAVQLLLSQVPDFHSLW